MTRGFWRMTVLWLAIACVVAGVPAVASAQISQAELRGVVHDESGGALPGVTTIHQPQCYQSAGGASGRAVDGIRAGAHRAADFNVYWGAGGAVVSAFPVPRRTTRVHGR